MTTQDTLWVVCKILRAIKNGRAAQAYALTVALAHYSRLS